ncbi:hypothetical protein O4157_20745 [Gordonia amicalis]|uniref:cyclic-phosphate processing receiver domain-containing protein n=1 Tax=Gordonia amicalis TaxID=89053 RepID=UPI0022B45407|nr:cyclic-phosphate processing receiver domain-containing protein [Gordonia amicalis]MCZ4653834.1 hypothetical protein [Gordonia amicalis]
MKLWVDDLRTPPDGWAWAKTSAEAIGMLTDHAVTEPSLDHDLGGRRHDASGGVVDVRARGMARGRAGAQRQPRGVEWLTGMVDRYRP